MSIDCKHFNGCSANLCPDDNEIDTKVWYPDEAICESKKYAKLHWIRQQRKIQRIVTDRSRLFTIAMLRRKFRVSAGLKGLNPAKNIDRQEKLWLKHRKGISKRKVNPKSIDNLRRYHRKRSQRKKSPSYSV